MWASSGWESFATATKEPLPHCRNCGQDVDVPRECMQHFAVYCSEWCALAGHRLRTGPKKPEHLNK